MSSQPNEDIASAVIAPAREPAREPAEPVAVSAAATSAATPPAKKRGRPAGSKYRSTLERLAREGAERTAAGKASRLMIPAETVAEAARDAGDAEVEEWGRVINLSGATVRCVWVLPVESGSEVTDRRCARVSFPGRDLCLTHVRAKAESMLVEMLEASEQSLTEAQFALREGARGAVDVLISLSSDETLSPNVRMKCAQILVEASGASLARTGPQTVVVTGETTILAGKEAAESAGRIVAERLARLAEVGPVPGLTTTDETKQPVELSAGPDGVWGSAG